MAKYRFGVQTKRTSDAPAIYRRIAAQVGAMRGAYTIEDLNRDAVSAFIEQGLDPKSIALDCGDCNQTTVYVRGSTSDHKRFTDYAKAHSVTMGVLLEAALAHQLANTIAEHRKFFSIADKVIKHANS